MRVTLALLTAALLAGVDSTRRDTPTTFVEDYPDGAAVIEVYRGDSAKRSAAAVQNSAFGPQRTLVVLVNFADKVQRPYTTSHAASVTFGEASNFYLANSYGQTSVEGDIAGWFTVPLSSTACDPDTLAVQAEAAAGAAGVDVASYPRRIFGHVQNSCGWWGRASAGGNPSREWVNGTPYNMRVVAHEMAHNFGLHHSKSLDCGAVSTCTNGVISEYGDQYDIMGSPSTGHLNAFQKERLGWLAPTMVTASGDFALEPIEAAPSALKVGSVYVELRQAAGVLVHQSVDDTFPVLLKGLPALNSWPLPVGAVFCDLASGVQVAPLSVSSGNALVRVEVDVTSCPPPPSPPAVTITDPVSNQQIPRRTTYVIRHTVTPGSNPIAALDCYAGGQFIPPSLSAPPWNCVWNVPNQRRSYVLQSFVRDTLGLGTSSNVVNVTVK